MKSFTVVVTFAFVWLWQSAAFSMGTSGYGEWRTSGRTREVREAKYSRYVAQAAAELMIDPALIEAVISNESAWNPKAVSVKGALGLMQLMPQTARNWGVKDPFDPRQNIMGGARHLRYLITLFDKNIPLALAAYHAGEAIVIRDQEIPQIKETQQYVRAVLDTYRGLSEGAFTVSSFSNR